MDLVMLLGEDPLKLENCGFLGNNLYYEYTDKNIPWFDSIPFFFDSFFIKKGWDLH